MGVITDGDLRRFFEKGREQATDLLSVKAGDVMTKGSKTIEADALAAKAVQVMEQYAITALVVVEAGDIPVGIVHLHDLLKAGVV